MIYRSLIRLLAQINSQPPYQIAYRYTRLFSLLRCVPGLLPLPVRPVDVMGLRFPNPMGLAAGFDRDGTVGRDIACAGFGFIEIGTINTDSRNSSGTELENIACILHHANSLSSSGTRPTQWPLIGISLGSLRDIHDNRAVADYMMGMTRLWRYADYLVINLSRPGSSTRTADIDSNVLFALLKRIKQGYAELIQQPVKRPPLIIKVSIEYQGEKTVIPDAIAIAGDLGFDGVLAAFEHWPEREQVNRYVERISKSLRPLSLITVGGILSADDALQTLQAGAALVQVYTALVEQGPVRIRRMITALSEYIDTDIQDGSGAISGH